MRALSLCAHPSVRLATVALRARIAPSFPPPQCPTAPLLLLQRRCVTSSAVPFTRDADAPPTDSSESVSLHERIRLLTDENAALRAKVAQLEGGRGRQGKASHSTGDWTHTPAATPSTADPSDAKPGAQADTLAMLQALALRSKQQAARSRVQLDMISTRMKSGNAKNAAVEAKLAADEATTPEERRGALDKMEQCMRNAALFKKEYKQLERKLRELPKDPFDPYTL
jgi:hypothetical protein